MSSPAPPYCLGHRHAQQRQLGELLHRFLGEWCVSSHVRRVRGQLARGELAAHAGSRAGVCSARSVVTGLEVQACGFGGSYEPNWPRAFRGRPVMPFAWSGRPRTRPPERLPCSVSASHAKLGTARWPPDSLASSALGLRDAPAGPSSHLAPPRPGSGRCSWSAGHHLEHEANLLGLGGVNGVAGEDQLLGARRRPPAGSGAGCRQSRG